MTKSEAIKKAKEEVHVITYDDEWLISNWSDTFQMWIHSKKLTYKEASKLACVERSARALNYMGYDYNEAYSYSYNTIGSLRDKINSYLKTKENTHDTV